MPREGHVELSYRRREGCHPQSNYHTLDENFLREEKNNSPAEIPATSVFRSFPTPRFSQRRGSFSFVRK